MADSSVRIETLDEFRARYQRPQPSLKYNPMKDRLPEDKWFNLNIDAINKKFDHIVNCGSKILQNAGSIDEELKAFRKDISTIKTFPSKKSTTIAIVGKQGMGKSSLCNALLQRPDLADTSNRGKACTQYMTWYVYRPGTSDREMVSDVIVKFVEKTVIEDLLGRLIAHYRFFHFTPQESIIDHSEAKELSESAEEVLQLVYNAEVDSASERKLNSLLTCEAIDTGELLNSAIEMALQRINDAGADANGIKSTYKLNDKQVREKRMEAATLWPLLKEVNIATGGVFLRNGGVLLDVPGFGDTNQTRVAVAHAARRKADHEFIVVEPGRIENDREVIKMLSESIKAHGTANTTLVINKIDDVANETTIAKEITNCQEHPFPTIHRYYLNTYLSENADYDDIGTKEDEVVIAYHKYLKLCAQNALLAARERETETQIQNKLGASSTPIRIFSISADTYNQWLVPLATKPNWLPEHTRVPLLRRFALGLTSQSNYDLYRNHCLRTVPRTTVDKLDRILQKHMENDGYSMARKQFMDHIPVLAEQLGRHINNCLEKDLPHIWQGESKTNQLNQVVNVVHQWANSLPWQTFDKLIRDGGIPIKSKSNALKKQNKTNLNDGILNSMQPRLYKWWNELQLATRRFAMTINNTINLAEKQLSLCLATLTGNDDLRTRALTAWNKEKESIRVHMDGLESKLQAKVNAIYKYATTEEDVLCPIAKLNAPYYLRASRVLRGEGLHVREREDFISGLQPTGRGVKNFVHRYERVVREKAKIELKSTLEEFKTSIIMIFEGFVKIMQEFLVTASQLTPHDLGIRDELRKWLPMSERTLTNYGIASQMRTWKSKSKRKRKRRGPRIRTNNRQVGILQSDRN